MASKLLFGFPLRARHAFTTIVEGGNYYENGTVNDWRDFFARTQGLTPVPIPRRSSFDETAETLGTDPMERLRERTTSFIEAQDKRTAFENAVNALLETLVGGC